VAAYLTQSTVETMLGLTAGTGPTNGLCVAAQAACLTFVGRSLDAATVTEYYDGRSHPRLPLRLWPVSAVANVWLDSGGNYGDAPNGFGSGSLLTPGTDYTASAPAGANGQNGPGLLTYLGGAGANSGGWTGFALTGYGACLSPTGRRSEFGWPRGTGNIKVQYTGGYSPIPDAVLTAIALQACSYQRTAKYGGMMLDVSESLGAYSHSIGGVAQAAGSKGLEAGGGLIGDVQSLLAPYKELSLGLP